MKETQEFNKDPTEPKEVIPVKTEQRLKARITLKKGCKIWTYDLKTKEVKEAEYEKQDASYMAAVNGASASIGKIITSPDLLYVEALNEKNATRKFNNLFR